MSDDFLLENEKLQTDTGMVAHFDWYSDWVWI